MAATGALKKSKRTRTTILLIVGLLPVLIAAAIWLGRDRIAIAMMERELRIRPPVGLIPLPAQDGALLDELRAYLVSHHRTPEAYILDQFDDHDIVFVGEHHRIKHDVELIHRLIPLLSERGVHNLGFEFAIEEDQPLIDRLVTAATYDGELAHRVLFNGSVMWGYQEYADVFRIAWELNRDLPAGAPTFRIVALGTRRDWSVVRSPDDLADEEILEKVWPKGDGDEIMAEIVLREIVQRGEKALVYCGIHHAFTSYRQPMRIRRDGTVEEFFDRRMGHLVYNEIGDRAFTIALHTCWRGRDTSGRSVYPADGAIDALMRTIDPSYRRAGFDTRGTPFGTLTGEMSDYARGRDDFTLADFCDGYVFQSPFSQYERVTLIPDFINRRNVDEAKERAANPRFRTGHWQHLGPEFINRLIAQEGDIDRTFAAFE
ncbi:MAG: ChaN family lipoprotein [Planctomycetota bacterium]